MSETMAVTLIAIVGIISIVTVAIFTMKVMVNTVKHENNKDDNEKY